MHGALRFPAGSGKGDALIKLHGDVCVQKILDLDRAFGSQVMETPIQMGLEGDALLVKLPKLGETHYLEAAAIGQDRSLPVHEAAQAAEAGYPLRARSQHEVIGVAQQYLCPASGNLLWQQSLDRAKRADRHESGGIDMAVGGRKAATSGSAVRGQDLER